MSSKPLGRRKDEPSNVLMQATKLRHFADHVARQVQFHTRGTQLVLLLLLLLLLFIKPTAMAATHTEKLYSLYFLRK